MKLLITGGNGMLGHKLVQELSSEHEVFTTIRRDPASVSKFGIFDPERTIGGIDLLDDTSLRNVLSSVRPDVVINAAGVIKQLPSSGNVINTLLVNAILPHRLFQYAQEFGFRLLIVSTDCVFSGAKGNYNESDPADALDLYGRSKNLGEPAGSRCLVIRTSIVGRELQTSHSLVEWFLSNRGKKVNGFTRAIYSGFPTAVFADIIGNLLSKHQDLSGLYHISSNPIDKCSLLTLLNEAFDAGVSIEPDDSFAIDRSLDSSKFRTETGFVPPSWEKMIERMAADRTAYDDFRL